MKKGRVVEEGVEDTMAEEGKIMGRGKAGKMDSGNPSTENFEAEGIVAFPSIGLGGVKATDLLAEPIHDHLPRPCGKKAGGTVVEGLRVMNGEDCKNFCAVERVSKLIDHIMLDPRPDRAAKKQKKRIDEQFRRRRFKEKSGNTRICQMEWLPVRVCVKWVKLLKGFRRISQYPNTWIKAMDGCHVVSI